MTALPAVNTATKYVASNTMTSHEWQPSVFLNGDIAEKITKIKQQEGPDLHAPGSANLVQTLMKHELVDAFSLMIFPVTLGCGKRLFAEGTIPAAFKVTESTVTSKGVIIVNYERAGTPNRKSINIRPILGKSTRILEKHYSQWIELRQAALEAAARKDLGLKGWGQCLTGFLESRNKRWAGSIACPSLFSSSGCARFFCCSPCPTGC